MARRIRRPEHGSFRIPVGEKVSDFRMEEWKADGDETDGRSHHTRRG